MKTFLKASALAAALFGASCTTSERTISTRASADSGSLSWDDNGNFFLGGVAMGRIDCTDYDDPRIDGSDADFAAFVTEKCTATTTPASPRGPEPCDPETMIFALDPGGYTIDTCVASDGSDPYWGGIAEWVAVPAWSNQFDAECWVEQATGNGCCAFYVDIDPDELSACDVVYPHGASSGSGVGSGGTGYGGTTYGSGSSARMAPGGGGHRIVSAPLAALAMTEDPPGNPDPLPTPPNPQPPRPPSRVWSRIGAILFGGISIFTPLIPEDLAKPIETVYERIVEEIERNVQNGRGPGRTAPRGGGIGAPPDPPPGWNREPFQRGGRRPPPDTTPPRPPQTLPPGGRPIPKPGQVAPQPSPRPPFRPR